MDNSSIIPAGVLLLKPISTPKDMANINLLLNACTAISQWRVGLDHCDKVLRVISSRLYALDVIELVNRRGYLCIELKN